MSAYGMTKMGQKLRFFPQISEPLEEIITRELRKDPVAVRQMGRKALRTNKVQCMQPGNQHLPRHPRDPRDLPAGYLT